MVGRIGGPEETHRCPIPLHQQPNPVHRTAFGNRHGACVHTRAPRDYRQVVTPLAFVQNVVTVPCGADIERVAINTLVLRFFVFRFVALQPSLQ